MSDQAILFSVIIPTYNRAAFIESTIRSVQNQHYQNWELIVVNDCSNDDTESIVKSIHDDRIKYILIPNSERGVARNVGIRMAKGDFVCFLDSDDQLLPNHLSEANLFIEKKPEVKVFHQGYQIKEQSGKVLFSSDKLPLLLNNELKKNNVISPNGIFIRTDIAKQNLFIEDRNLAGTEDYELWLRLSVKYPIPHHPVITSMLIDHAGRSMKEADIDKLMTRIQLFIKYVEENKVVKNWIGDFSKFKARRYSYIALHAAVAKHNEIAVEYLKLALKNYPLMVFTKRFYVISKNIFIG